MRRIGEEQASVGEIEKFEETEISIASAELVGSICPFIDLAKARVARSVNSEPAMLYWQIGKKIREEISARKIAGQEKGVIDLLSNDPGGYRFVVSRSNLFWAFSSISSSLGIIPWSISTLPFTMVVSTPPEML